MAGRQPVVHAGLRFTTRPSFWLRRWTHFPFHFESHNPSFTVRVERVAEVLEGEDWPEGKVPFEVVFADGTKAVTEWPVLDLKVREYGEVMLKNVFTAYPGRTIIRIPFGPGEWKTLYAYDVWREESLWIGVWGVAIAVASFALGVVIGHV